MHYYDPYAPNENLAVLAALVKIWDPPPSAGPTELGGLGNCIESSRFASRVLDALYVEHDITIVRAHYTAAPYGGSVGWGDCGSFVVPTKETLGAHCVLVGAGWLFDASAAQFAGQDGPLIALPSLPHDRGVHYARHLSMPCDCEWMANSIWYHRAYGFEPIQRHTPRGTGAAVKKHIAAVRKIIGPRRKPRAYSL